MKRVFNKIKVTYMINSYKFRHWMFRWNKDEEGDIVFSIVGVLHFVKYKEHTIVKFGNHAFEPAKKWVEA